MVVAIDGPAGTGKSTVSRLVAQRTDFFYLNSGRFYRAITWKALARRVTRSEAEALISIASDIDIDIDGDRFLVDGVERTTELHTAAIDDAVAEVSSIPEVRNRVNERLKRIAGERDIVVEGRDMSTVVFPDAEVKVFLDASPHVRARRRYDQLGGQGGIEAIQRAIEERDRIDRTKPMGRLKQSKEALYIDTTDLTIDQVCAKVVAIIHEKITHGRSN